MNIGELKDQINKIAHRMAAGFSDQETLLDQFDSIQIITLVTEVEKALGVQLPAVELSRENLKSVESLANLVGRYQTGK